MSEPAGYEVIAEFDDPETGIHARVTRKANPHGPNDWHGFRLSRNFTRAGEDRETSWFHAEHLNALRTMLQRIEERLRVER